MPLVPVVPAAEQADGDPPVVFVLQFVVRVAGAAGRRAPRPVRAATTFSRFAVIARNPMPAASARMARLVQACCYTDSGRSIRRDLIAALAIGRFNERWLWQWPWDSSA